MQTLRTRGLGERDKLILERRLEGQNIRQIADSVSVAPSTVCRTLKGFEPELTESLWAAGLGLDKAVEKLAQLMEQKKKLQFTYQGVVIDEVEVEPTTIQFRAAELLLRLHGALDNRSEKKPPAPQTSGIRISIPLTLDETKELAAAGFNVIAQGDPEPV